MKKVVHFIEAWRAGGAERVITRLCDYMVNDYDVYVVVLETYHDTAINPHIKLIEIYNYDKLKIFLDLVKPDIFFTHQYWGLTQFDVITIVQSFNIPIGLIYHNSYEHTKLDNDKAANIRVPYYKSLDSLICLNKATADKFLKNDNIKSIVIHNPLTFDIQSQITKRDIEKKDKNYIIAIGRYNDTVKNLSGVIEIFSYVLEKNNNAVLHVVGEYKKHVANKLLKKFAINPEKIVFHGHTTNVSQYLKKAGILLHAALREGMPMAFLEAKAYGIPIVAAKFDGIEEVIEHQKDGYIYDQLDYKTAASYLLTLLEENTKYSSFIENSYKNATKFSLETIGHKWNELINDLTSKNSPHPDYGFKKNLSMNSLVLNILENPNDISNNIPFFEKKKFGVLYKYMQYDRNIRVQIYKLFNILPVFMKETQIFIEKDKKVKIIKICHIPIKKRVYLYE